jgi:hypothetical protein
MLALSCMSKAVAGEQRVGAYHFGRGYVHFFVTKKLTQAVATTQYTRLWQ